MSTNPEKPLTFRFIDVETDVRLELSNVTDNALKCVEILTVFLKDSSADLLARLKVIAGEVRPYVLDISWQDPEGKTRFQRIPVGH